MSVPIEEEKQTLGKATTTATATSKAPETTVNTEPEDPRFAEVKSEENQTLTEMSETYDGMIADSDKFFDEQIDATEKWGDKQAQLQQDQTDFLIDTIEQKKDQAQKDYVKEQSGAYVDWQKQSNAYGTDAERKASNGLTNTGYSESSQVAMYNAYQNRVAVARESVNKAMLEYDNAIKEAQLQNNVALAEIAYTTLYQKLQLSLQGFQNKNELLLDKFNTKLQVKQHYDTQWQNVLDNIYREKSFALQEDQFEYGKAQDAKNNALNLILSGVGNEQLYKEAGLSFEVGEALKNSFVSEREKLDLDIADQNAGTLLNLAQMGIKVPLTEGLKKMGITQSMLDSIINMSSAASVSSGGGSGSGSGGSSYTNTYLKQLYKDGNYDAFFSALAERGDIVAEAQALGISAHEINYLNDKGLTSLEQAKYMLKNHGKEKYSDTDIKRMLSGAYTENEFYGSGHQMSAYDSYEDYLNNHFKKFINF